MKQKGTYVVCFLFLGFLICSAFWAPGLLIQWNDEQLLGDYQFRERDGIDYEALNSSYIASMQERLSTFAKGVNEGRQYFVAVTEEEPQDWDEVLTNVFAQEISGLLLALGIPGLSQEICHSENITAREHYVIYEKDNVAFLCWYIELKTGQEMVRLLIDAVDRTIYYAEYYRDGMEELQKSFYNSGWMNSVLMGLKSFYGDDSYVVSEKDKLVYDANKKWNKQSREETVNYVILSNGQEIVSDLKLDGGQLQIGISFLDQIDDRYGIGIGIREIKDFLPRQRKGTGKGIYE